MIFAKIKGYGRYAANAPEALIICVLGNSDPITVEGEKSDTAEVEGSSGKPEPEKLARKVKIDHLYFL